jgi:hypothetical protein
MKLRKWSQQTHGIRGKFGEINKKSERIEAEIVVLTETKKNLNGMLEEEGAYIQLY